MNACQPGQALTSLLVWLRALEAEADGSAGVIVSRVRLQELKTILADTLEGVRDLALELRPSVLDDLGLVPALQRDNSIPATRSTITDSKSAPAAQPPGHLIPRFCLADKWALGSWPLPDLVVCSERFVERRELFWTVSETVDIWLESC